MKEPEKGGMHLNDRHQQIMNIMRRQNAVSVAALASMMKVSEVTIRKDLSILEEQKLLYRVHGSAILVNRYINDRSMAEKELLCADEKRAIGKFAATLVTPRDTIMITSGTTTQYFANEISVKDSLTAITSTFNVATALVSKGNVEVIQLGGIVREASMAVLGPFAEQMVQMFAASKIFFGVDGVDLEFGLTTTNHMEAHLQSTMINNAQKVITLADHTKFNRRGYIKICDLENVDHIITDWLAPVDVVERIRDKGIEVTMVDSNGKPI
jgi:DeoR family transcriptional regulator of aga operon